MISVHGTNYYSLMTGVKLIVLHFLSTILLPFLYFARKKLVKAQCRLQMRLNVNMITQEHFSAQVWKIFIEHATLLLLRNYSTDFSCHTSFQVEIIILWFASEIKNTQRKTISYFHCTLNPDSDYMLQFLCMPI